MTRHDRLFRPGSGRRRGTAAIVLATVAGLGAALVPGPQASADPATLQYAITTATSGTGAVSGGLYAGTSTATVKVVITSKTTHEDEVGRLQSADLPIPSGLTYSGTPTMTSDQSGFAGTIALSGSTLQLRNLNLKSGKKVTITLASVAAECAADHTPYSWALTATSPSPYGVYGSVPATPVTGVCALKFVTQPANSQKNTTITSEEYLPTGVAVKVGAVDASPTPAPVANWTGNVTVALDPSGKSGTLSNGGPVAVSGATASVAPQIAESGKGYKLKATGTSSGGTTLTPTTSNAFTIVDVGIICPAVGPCTGSSIGEKSEGSFDASTNSGTTTAKATLDIDPGSSSFCLDGYVPSTDLLTVDVTDATRSKTFTLRLYASYVNRRPSEYKVCYRSPNAFTQVGNVPAVGPDGDGNYAGFLRECSVTTSSSTSQQFRNRGTTTTVTNPPPCVKSRRLDWNGDVVIVVQAPPGDPAFMF